MEDKDRKMIVTDENGKEKEMLILFTTRLDEFNKNYIFYTDPNDQEGEVYVSSYELETTKLNPIEDDKEWEALNDVLQAYIEDTNNNEACEGCEGKDCATCDKCGVTIEN